MDAQEAAKWMLSELEREDCLYQDDVVDFLVKSKADHLLRENSDGNLALERPLLNEFRKLTEKSVVWVVPERYWRYRVPEDEPGRNSRG